MTPDEFGFAAEGAKQKRRETKAQVLIVGDEKAELSGQVGEDLVMRSGGEENTPALVLLDVVVDGAITTALAVSEVVALIEDDETIASQGRQFLEHTGVRQHFAAETVALGGNPATLRRGFSGRG